MCHPAWAPARAPAPYPRELVRVRRVRDLIDRDLGATAQAAHDGARRLPLDVAVLASRTGISEGALVREFTRAYGMSPDTYAASRCHSLCPAGSSSGRSVATMATPG